MEKRFYFGFMGWFVILFGLWVLFSIGYVLLQGFNIFYLIVLILLFFTWFYYVTNSNILIKDGIIYFPRQFDFVKELFFGLGTFIAVFKPKPNFKISEIKSVDILFGIHQPLILKFRDDEFRCRMKLFHKRTVINLLKTLKRENPNIDFSKRCNEIMELKSGLSQTKSEKRASKGKKQLALIILGMLILAFVLIFYAQSSGEVKQDKFDITKISGGYEHPGRIGKYSIRINTEQGTFFTITVRSSFKDQAEKLLETVNNDNLLLNDVIVTYKDRFGLFRNVINITLLDGQTFNLGTGDN